MPTEFRRRGFALRAGFLTEAECDRYCQSVRALEAAEGLPLIERRARGRSLCYKVVDGARIDSALPGLADLSDRVSAAMERAIGESLRPLADPLAARNVNVTPPGGGYRWHYDRNAVTAILFLNEVPGGQTEMFPNYRVVVGPGRRRLQWSLDAVLRLRPVRRLFGRRVLVTPALGALLIMRGDRALHSVRMVGGVEDRMTVIIAYDIPGHDRPGLALDDYLYSAAPVLAGDPNYR